MAGLKELTKKCFNTQEIDLSDLFANGLDTESSVKYAETDALAICDFHSRFNLVAMQEQINKDCERETIQAIKGAADRFVTFGGSPKFPMVIVDMVTREYNVLYGFGETCRGYWLALRKQGFNVNYNLFPKAEQSDYNLLVHNVKYDRSILDRE